MLQTLIQQLHQDRALQPGDVTAAVEQLVDESVSAEQKADFLIALRSKGETPQEIAAFAKELRGRSVPLPFDDNTTPDSLMDVCGTGGDGLNTFNISTSVALLLAAAEVTVAKHGNRAVTSRSGSADVLQSLGIRTDLSPTEAVAWLKTHHFAFLFAPLYHPAFKHIGPARKLCAARGQHTLFNFLGPLLNPAHTRLQLMGVPRPELCKPLATVLQLLGIRRGMVVSGRVTEANRSLDELSTLGENTLAEFYHPDGLNTSTLDVSPLPLQRSTLKDLAGGDSATNADIIRNLLSGKDRGPRRDALLLNAGAALLVADRAKSITDGWEQAADVIDSGRARQKLENLVRASG